MINSRAGKRADINMLVDIPRLISAYYEYTPNPKIEEQRVIFGTSGHRGSSLKKSFNEAHISAITQAVCEYRKSAGINGPLFIGIDTHALSVPAQNTAVEVSIANGVDVYIAKEGVYTPTPLLSFAILQHNKNSSQIADGIVITPSHNPPEDGGFKYNPPNGGPADTDITSWIANRSNELLENGLKDVKRVSIDEALHSNLCNRYDFVTPYVESLSQIVDMNVIANSGLKICADALGGSSLSVYPKIKDIYSLDNMDIINEHYDPTFSFMTLDHDGKIRMDCSSPYAMASLLKHKDNYDLAFANDTDADRHGIVTPVGGLMNPNHFLSVAIWYLFTYRKDWNQNLKIGKTLVSSAMIDRVAKSISKEVYEVPVGFKWFVDGLYEEWLGFGGEESAGASFLKFDGTVWSTDKDGIIMDLLSVEIKAVTGKDPAEIYNELEEKFGRAYYGRVDAVATTEQKKILKNLSASDITANTLSGEKIKQILTKAPGNGASIGGLKLITANGWVAMRPSGTEDIYKIYAESFISQEHLAELQSDASKIISDIFKANR